MCFPTFPLVLLATLFLLTIAHPSPTTPFLCSHAQIKALITCAKTLERSLPPIEHPDFPSILEDLSSKSLHKPCKYFSKSSFPDPVVVHTKLVQTLDTCFLDEHVTSVRGVKSETIGRMRETEKLVPVHYFSPAESPFPESIPIPCSYECRECNMCGIECFDVGLLQRHSKKYVSVRAGTSDMNLRLAQQRRCPWCFRVICKVYCKNAHHPFCPLVV